MIGLALHHRFPYLLTTRVISSILPFFFSLFLYFLLHNFPFFQSTASILFVTVGRREPMTEFLGLPSEKYLMFGLKSLARLQPCHWESLFSSFTFTFSHPPPLSLTESVSSPNPPGCGYLRVGAILLVTNYHQWHY